jgi:hypothetical protein
VRPPSNDHLIELQKDDSSNRPFARRTVLTTLIDGQSFPGDANFATRVGIVIYSV